MGSKIKRLVYYLPNLEHVIEIINVVDFQFIPDRRPKYSIMTKVMKDRHADLFHN